MPAGIPIDEAEFVPLSQLYGQFAEVVSEDGTQRFEGEVSWSETNLVQAIARWPGGRAWYRVHENRLGERVRERTVADMIEQARAAGAVVREEPPFTSVLVQASVTQTLGGILVDSREPRRRRRGPVRGGRGRRRDRDGRLLERARRGARLRPDRRRGSAQLVAGQQVRAGPAVLRERRLGDPVHDPAAVVVQLDGRPHGRRLALAVQELVAGRLGDEQAVSGLGGHAGRVYRRTL